MLTAVLLLCTASCSGSGATLTFPLTASPETLDPQYCTGTAAKIIVNNCFEGLTRLNQNGEVIPGAASSWSCSADGLTYTFTLRGDSLWRYTPSAEKTFGEEFYEKINKTPVTAADFVFAFRRAVMPQTSSPWAPLFGVIKNAGAISQGKLGEAELGVAAVNAATLAITLESPCADFLERLSHSAFMPCNEEFFNKTGGRYGLAAKYILCNGPFYVRSWDSASKLVASRSAGYKGESKVVAGAVHFVFDCDSASVAEKLVSGAYSAAMLAPYDIPADGSVKLTPIEDTVYGFCFNCADASLSDVDLRLGLCLSIDRSLFAAPKGMQLCSGVIPGCCEAGGANYRASVGNSTRALSFDKAAALEHWQKGLAAVGTERVEITVICAPGHDEAVRKQLQVWQQVLGISFSGVIDNIDEKEIKDRIAIGDYQLAFAPVSSPDTSAAGFVACFKQASEDNIFNYKSADYDMVADKILNVYSQGDMLNGCFTAETMLLEQGVCYPVFSCPSYFGTAPGVSGIYCSASGDNVCFITGNGPD